MKHVNLFENFGGSSNPGQGPFLVMYYNLERGEKEPIGIFSTLQEAEEYVWDETKGQVGSLDRESWYQFLNDLSGGLVKSVTELKKNLDKLKYEECYYEILENGKNMMKKVSDQWKVIANHLM